MQLERVARIGVPPLHLTSFVGRTHELAAITRLLRNPDVRLATITGPGGSGKTRLALQGAAAVAEDFPDGCFFVDLAPLHSPDQVPCALACALDVPEPSDQIGVSALLAFLRWKRLLLIVDNCEHLPGAADLFSDIIGNAGTVTLLATSRIALGIYGEHELPIGPLELPEPQAGDIGALLNAPAVQLFLQRAESVRPGLIRPEAHAAIIAELCRRLDGLPLAIELAAARIKLFPPAALLEHLDRTGLMHTLIHGPRNMPARHQTLQATIAWSHDLLHPEEQRLFRRIAVFAGMFDTEAAAAVCGISAGEADRVPELLATLVEQNLLYVTETSTSVQTFGLLETIRAYALERLEESGEANRIRSAHLTYYAGLAWASELGLYGPGRLRWLARLDAAYPNIRAALMWGLVDQGDRTAGLRLAATLWSYWRARSLFGETYHCLQIAALRDPLLPAGLRARVLAGIAWVIDRQSNLDRAIELAHEALSLANQSGDRTTQLYALTIIALEDRDPKAATEVRQRCLALAEHESNPWLRYHVLLRCARPAPDAEPAIWDSFWADLERYAAASGDPWLHSDLLLNQFYALLHGRDRGALRRIIAEHTVVAQLIGSLQAVALTEEFSARLATAEGRWDDALRHQQARLDAERTLGNASGIANALLEIAMIHIDRSELAEAERQSSAALELLRPIDDYQGMCFGLLVSAWIRLWRADLVAAVHYCEIGLDLLTRIKRRSTYEHLKGQFLILLGLAAFADGRFEVASERFRAGLTDEQTADDVHDEFARFGLGLLAARRGDYDEAFALMDPIVGFLRSQEPRALVIALWGLAPIKLAAGAIAEARALCLEGLDLVARLKLWIWGFQLLEVFAAITAQQGDLPTAVRWWAMVGRQREAPGIRIWTSDREAYEQRLAQARATLGEEAFGAAWSAGRQLDWTIALAEVLAVPERAAHLPADDTRQELAMAAEIQSGLLPKSLPQPPGWHVAATLIPARETAGDFYDCITLPDGRLALVIADVAGKGLGPALYMATARALIRTLVASVTVEPGEVLTSVNVRLLDDTHTSLFITAFYGVLDPVQGILTYANAGHPPPLLAHPGASAVHALMPTGMVLGIEPEAGWHQEVVRLQPGSLLVLYTDGITEAQNLRRELFEEERLCDLLQAHMPLTAERAIAAVIDGVHRFVGAAPQSDDITLLAVAWGAG